nr:ATP synthase CF1 subunit delta [Cystoclonium purpureum f. stellatum]
MSNQIIIAKVVLPYAEALLDYSSQNNLINEINQDLSIVSGILSDSAELRLFLNNPLTAVDVKKTVIRQLLSKQVNSFLLKFLLVLVDRRRITLLSAIIKKYFDLVYKLDSTTIAKISTPIIFNEVQQYNLINKLKEMTNSKKVKLKINIDTSLIGGFTIQVGSKIIDTSLSGKLQKMAFYLNAN